MVGKKVKTLPLATPFPIPLPKNSTVMNWDITVIRKNNKEIH